MIFATLMKPGAAKGAVESASQIAAPDDLTAEQEQLQCKGNAMDPETRLLTQEVIAVEEDLVRTKMQLTKMEGTAVGEATEKAAE